MPSIHLNLMHNICISQAGGNVKTQLSQAFVLPDGFWRLEDSLLTNKHLLLSGGKFVCYYYVG